MGADALMPLLVLVAVHAHLPHGFACIDFASRYCESRVASSELGYYLACLEAALTYLTQASPDDPQFAPPQEHGATRPKANATRQDAGGSDLNEGANVACESYS
eukprot:6183147-Pleurochrysis_carterae.AAC.2